jgi:hypothetical protein
VPLTGPQISTLVAALDAHMDAGMIGMLANDLGVNLANEAPGADAKGMAFKLATLLNAATPPRDAELLEAVHARGNAALKAVVAELLRPAFFSPSGDPHDAILLGRRAFVDRDDLRATLKEFTNPSPYSTRVLIVSGNEPCGKSYTWEFLRHLAWASVGAKAQRLRLKATGYTPRQLVEQVFALLQLDRSGLPEMKDDPQLARVEPLIAEFKGKLATMGPQRYWLVIDDLNDTSALPSTAETAFALAQAVEEVKPDALWMALLGYNAPITDPELLYVARDDPRFPDPVCVAAHFRCIAETSPSPLTQERALEIASVLFSKYDALDKAAMTELTPLLERMGEKLRQGLQP